MTTKPLLTVSTPTDGTQGTHYILTHSDGQTRDLYDGQDEYWQLARLIERVFDGDDVRGPIPSPTEPAPVNNYSCVVNVNRTVTFGFDGHQFILNEQQANHILAYLVRTATITVEL